MSFDAEKLRKLLNDSLDLYLRHDKQKEINEAPVTKQDSILGQVWNMAYSLAVSTFDYFIGRADVEKKLNQITDDIRKELKPGKKDPDDWVRLALLLGDFAMQAQAIKPRAGLESRCCAICHLMRNQIITELRNDNGEYYKAWIRAQNQTIKNINKCKKNYDYFVAAKRGSGAADHKIKLSSARRYLAYLENPQGITGAEMELAFISSLEMKLPGPERRIPYLLKISERELQLQSETSLKTSFCHYQNNSQFPYLLQENAAQIVYHDRYYKVHKDANKDISVEYKEFYAERMGAKDYKPAAPEKSKMTQSNGGETKVKPQPPTTPKNDTQAKNDEPSPAVNTTSNVHVETQANVNSPNIATVDDQHQQEESEESLLDLNAFEQIQPVPSENIADKLNEKLATIAAQEGAEESQSTKNSGVSTPFNMFSQSPASSPTPPPHQQTNVGRRPSLSSSQSD